MNIQLPEQDHRPVVARPSTNAFSLSTLDRDQIEALFRQHGARLFRGVSFDIDEFSQFTDLFCSAYVSNESPGREVLSADGRVQTVNTGHQHFPLHPELSREPWQPDIAWFACEQPATMQGETTLCDGVAAVLAFPPELFDHLAKNKLAHILPADLDWCAEFLGIPELKLSDLSKEYHSSEENLFQFSVRDNEIFRTYFRPMLHKPMFSSNWAYGNFLVFARRNLRVRHFPCYADGSEVPDSIVMQIEGITNRLAYAHKWQKHDLLMLDNTRFLHGRNPIGDPQSRRIFTQFGYANFAPQDYPNIDTHRWRKST